MRQIDRSIHQPPLRLASATLLASASSAACGGPCDYRTDHGTCTIVAVEALSSGPVCTASMVDSASITFDFTPDDPAAGPDTGLPLLVGLGTEYHPPRDWAFGHGLTVGSIHGCSRQTITSGSCTAVMYEFDRIDLRTGGDWTGYCH